MKDNNIVDFISNIELLFEDFQEKTKELIVEHLQKNDAVNHIDGENFYGSFYNNSKFSTYICFLIKNEETGVYQCFPYWSKLLNIYENRFIVVKSELCFQYPIKKYSYNSATETIYIPKEALFYVVQIDSKRDKMFFSKNLTAQKIFESFLETTWYKQQVLSPFYKDESTNKLMTSMLKTIISSKYDKDMESRKYPNILNIEVNVGEDNLRRVELVFSSITDSLLQEKEVYPF